MTGIVAQNVGRTSGLIKSAGGGGGVWTLISTFTSDGSDATADFTSGIDSTYPIYVFKFITIHGETNTAHLMFQGSTDGGSSYGVTITSSALYAAHAEADIAAEISPSGGGDLAQSTDFQRLVNAYDTGNENDECCSGYLHLFAPSDTTFIKHFMSRIPSTSRGNFFNESYQGGYFNTTSAIDAIQFKMNSGDIQGGKIKLYGLSDS